VPAIRPPGGQRFDVLGAIALFVSLLCLLLALTLGQEAGLGSRPVLLLLAGWLAALALFIRVELISAQPMIDLRLFRVRLFTVNLITGFATFISIAGTLILMPFYLQGVLGYEPRQVGLLLAAVPVALGVTSPISGSLSDRLGSRPITDLGLVVLLVGYFALSTLATDTGAFGYFLRFLPIGVGMGLFQSPNNSAIMGTAPRGRLGVVSGMLALTRTLGQTAGIALLGAWWAGRVFAHTGTAPAGGPTAAAPADQVAGLQDTFRVILVLITIALVLSLWTLSQERRDRARPNPGNVGRSK
jgi:MFS family permease